MLKFFSKTFYVKKAEADRILSKHPDRVPIIVTKNKLCKDIQDVDKIKYLVPLDLTVYKFSYVLRSRLNLPSHQAFIIYQVDPYTNTKRFLTGASIMAEVYDTYKAPDGFLYLEYDSENTFG
jgi:hypothetical protein